MKHVIISILYSSEGLNNFLDCILLLVFIGQFVIKLTCLLWRRVNYRMFSDVCESSLEFSSFFWGKKRLRYVDINNVIGITVRAPIDI